MTTTLLRKVLYDYLDNNTVTVEDKQQIESTIQELDDIDNLSNNALYAILKHDWCKQHIYDTDGGCNPEAAEQFKQAVVDLISNKTGFDITVNADGHILKAYDNAQFVTDLLIAVENYKNDIAE